VWLRARNCEHHSKDLERYARKNWRCLREGDFSSLKGTWGLVALASLSKFLGRYDEFQRLRVASGLGWAKHCNSVEAAFQRMYSGKDSIDKVEAWVDGLSGVKIKYRFPIVFGVLSGLRVVETVLALEKIRVGGLDGYLNRQLMVLEHFKDKAFSRKTKKAYFSVMTEKMVENLEEWHKLGLRTSYWTLLQFLKHHGIACNLDAGRKWFASVLLREGIGSEIVDLLSGRVGSSVLLRHYFAPNVDEEMAKVRKVLEKYSSRWLM
jgi:hypothetical protein